MGLNETNNFQKIFLNIVGGKITRRFNEHQFLDEKQITIEREIFDDKNELVETKIEKYYDSISGIITKAKSHIGQYGTTLSFTIISDEIEYVFQVKFNTSYGRSILMRLPNIDTDETVEFLPYNFESKTDFKNGKAKKIVGVSVKQFNKKINPFWTKDNPKDLPNWEKTTVAGQDKWNTDKQDEYLHDFFISWSEKFVSDEAGVRR